MCVVLNGRETLSLTLREECRLKVFENRVLRRICGPKKDEVTGEWRKLHKEEINDLYSPPNIIRVIKSRRWRWVGHLACMGERKGVYRFLVRKPKGRRPRRRWEDNIKMDLQFRRNCANTVAVEKQKLLRILSVFVALCIQHEMGMRRIIL